MYNYFFKVENLFIFLKKCTHVKHIDLNDLTKGIEKQILQEFLLL